MSMLAIVRQRYGILMCQGNMIRYGVAMYGLNPSGNKLAPSYALKAGLTVDQ